MTPVEVQKGARVVWCSYCGRSVARDLGCSFCNQIQRARYTIEQTHSGEGLQHQNLVKFAGHLAAGMHSGFMTAKSGGFYPTRAELNQAATWALEQFLATQYVLREKPNGSMSAVDVVAPPAVES